MNFLLDGVEQLSNIGAMDHSREIEMLALLLPTLFAASAFLALAAIGSSWGSYGEAVRALRRQAGECVRSRDLRYTLITTTVRWQEIEGGATIHRPEFRPVARNLALYWPGQPELRAAA